jgi:hypothetical protein
MLFTTFSDRKLSLMHTGNKRKFCVLVSPECAVVHITYNVEYKSNKKFGAITGMRIDPVWKYFSDCHRD